MSPLTSSTLREEEEFEPNQMDLIKEVTSPLLTSIISNTLESEYSTTPMDLVETLYVDDLPPSTSALTTSEPWEASALSTSGSWEAPTPSASGSWETSTPYTSGLWEVPAIPTSGPWEAPDWTKKTAKRVAAKPQKDFEMKIVHKVSIFIYYLYIYYLFLFLV